MSRSRTGSTGPARLHSVTAGAPDEPVHVGELSALGEERLGRLLDLRPDLAEPLPGSLAALVDRSMSLTSVSRALAGADQLVLQLAQVLTIVGQGHAPLADVLDMVGDVPEGDVQRGLTWLEDRHLVCRLPGPELCVHPGVLSIAGAGALGPPAASLVEMHSVAELRSVLETVGHRSRATRKASLVEELLALLNDPDGVRALVDQAPPEIRDFAHHIAREAISVELPWYADRSPAGPTRAATWLVQRGLVFKDTWHTAVMPREVGLALRGGRPFPASSYQRPPVTGQPATGTGRPPAAAWPSAAEARARTAVDAVERLIETWGSKPAALLKSGGVGVREVRRLAGIIELPEPDTFRLVEMAGASGLVVDDTRQHLAMPTAAADDWLDLGPADRWWALAESWLETPQYPSLAGLEAQGNKTIPALGYPPGYNSSAARLRRAVLRALLDLPDGHGSRSDELGAAVLWDAPLLWRDVPGRPVLMVEWTVAEMELLGLAEGGVPTVLARPLAEGDLGAVRGLLADPGAGAWQLVLQADLTALVTGPVPSAVRAHLELLADVEGRGAATLYRFSDASVRRAFDAGRSAQEILGFLAEHAAKGVPQPLTYLVGDVERRHGQVRLGRAGCYVRFEDAALAAEVVRGARTAKLGFRQIAPTVLVCDQPNDAVLKALRAAGYLPVVESEDGSVVPTPVTRHRAEIRPAPRALAAQIAGARSAGSGGGPADRWRARLSGGSGPGPEAPTGRALAAQLLRSAGTGSRAPGGHPEPGRAGPGRGPSAGVPARFPAGRPGEDRDLDGDDPAGLSELARFGGFAPDDDGEDDDGPERPTEIFRDRQDIADLLEQALVEDWLVRLSYTSASGRSSESTVFVLGMAGPVVHVEVAPRWTRQRYLTERISWARALTEAEQEMVP